jgi:CRISPR type III-A-associated protein Csm2
MSIDWSFLEEGYYVRDANGYRMDTIRPELIGETARNFGVFFANGRNPSKTQLRGFYADAKTLENKMRGSGVVIGSKAFKQHEYLIRMLKAKVAYVYGKETGKYVSREFKRFIDTCIDAVQDERDFEAFMRLFESTVGFYFGRAGEISEEEKQQQQRERKR